MPSLYSQAFSRWVIPIPAVIYNPNITAMRTTLFFACCLTLIVSITTACTQNSVQSSQTLHQTDTNSDMNNSTVFSSQESSDSSDSSNSSSSVSSYSSSSDSSAYQHSSLSLNAVNLRQPHLLKINSSATQLTGEITVNGKVVKRFSHSREEINLSPLLSVGEQKVQISARYAPASSSTLR